MSTITAQAAAGAQQAFAVARTGGLLRNVTLRLGPTTDAYDPETEAQTITWEQETTGVEALQYSDKSTRDNKNQMVNFETRVQSFIVLGASVTAGRPNQSGNVTDADGITWQIAECLTDPTNAIWIFHCTT